MFFGTTFFDGVTFFSFLSHGMPNRQREIGIGDHTFSADNGIACKGSDVLCAHHDLALGIHREFPQGPRHRTGKSQFAGRIKKQSEAIADAVVLAAGPKAGPLVDRQVLTRCCAADGIFNLERDGGGSRVGARR